MGSFQDLTGQRFGYWTVIERDAEGRYRWICRCDCGRIKSIAAQTLKKGDSKSCGCKSSEMRHNALSKDVTGQRFGRLIAEEYAGHIGKFKYNAWRCKCDCGNTTIVRVGSLLSGKTQSCGCLQKERASEYKLIDLTGKRFGRLVAISKEPRRCAAHSSKTRWLCLCDCGNKKTVDADSLTKGTVKSCGCLQSEQAAIQGKKNTKHGGSRRTAPKERLFRIWANMRDRCNNSGNHAYKHYGGRGISICDEWGNYTAFRDWAHNNGYSDKLTIDRIDVNGNYEPSNCRWATQKEQANNTRVNRRITAFGQTHTLSEWAGICKLSSSLISARLKRGWDAETAITKPPQCQKKNTSREGKHESV